MTETEQAIFRTLPDRAEGERGSISLEITRQQHNFSRISHLPAQAIQRRNREL